jgi:metal-dependent amidase/aminoacylase/carboxypeptidase family protein
MLQKKYPSHAGELVFIPAQPRRPLMFGTRGTFGKNKPDRTVVFLTEKDALAYESATKDRPGQSAEKPNKGKQIR